MEIFNTTWKVLIPVFQQPTKGLTIREISRLCKISHPSVIRIIKTLKKRKILTVEEIGKQHAVKGNFESDEFVELKKIYNIISLKPLVSYVTEKYYPDVIIVFGSYANGTDFEKSDIDIYVGYKHIDMEGPILRRFEKSLGRKIEIFSGKLEDYPKNLIENIINGVKLYGWLKL